MFTAQSADLRRNLDLQTSQTDTAFSTRIFLPFDLALVGHFHQSFLHHLPFLSISGRRSTKELHILRRFVLNLYLFDFLRSRGLWWWLDNPSDWSYFVKFCVMDGLGVMGRDFRGSVRLEVIELFNVRIYFAIILLLFVNDNS